MIKFRSSTRTRRRCTRSPAPSPPSWRTPWPPPPGSRQEEGIDDYDEDDDEGVEDTDESNIILIIKIRTLIFAPVLALSHAIRFYSHSLADIKGYGQSLKSGLSKCTLSLLSVKPLQRNIICKSKCTQSNCATLNISLLNLLNILKP